MQMTFIIPIGDETIYEQCFNRSPLFKKNPAKFEVLAQRRYSSAAKAFNAALDVAKNDLVVICHQDIVLPGSWAETFTKCVEQINHLDPNWGVIGHAGMTLDERVAAHVYRHDRELRGDVPLPARVRTLDESFIAFRRSSGLRFDDELPGFYFYAVDICLQAEVKGMQSYAVDAPCFHQARNRASQQASFFELEKRIINKWKNQLPIQTLSGRVAGRGYLIYKRFRNRYSELLATCGYHGAPWWESLPKISPERLLE